MGKILETIGVIDGYDIVTIGKLKAKNDELFEEIEKIESNIKNEIRDIVNTSSGKVFAIIKKRKIKGIYLFKIEDKDNLRLLKTIYVDEVSEDIQNKYDEFILKIAKDYVSTQEYKKVIIDEKVVHVATNNNAKNIYYSSFGGFIAGFMIGWLIFDDVIWGLMYGTLFAPIFGGVNVVVSNKRGRKKKKQ